MLKNKELRDFGEYRTGKLVLREFDRMALAKANDEPYISLLNPPPGQQTQPTYSTHGIVKDEIDARLLGLLLAMVQQGGSSPRRHLTDALSLAGQSTLLGTFADAQGIDIVAEYQRRHPSIFDASRLAGDRTHAWLRHLESVGVIRFESQADLLVALPGAAVPTHVMLDDETVRIAAVLTQAAAKIGRAHV